MVLEKAMKEVNKRARHLDEMIENANEMVPRKKGGPLDPYNAWHKPPKETEKIMGETRGEVLPNKLLGRFKKLVKE